MRQFIVDQIKPRPGVAAIQLHILNTQNMHEKTGALHMAQKTVTQALPGVCAFDQPRNVRDDHAVIRIVLINENSEIGRQRGKGIIRDFRTRGGHTGKKGGLARIGQPQQPRIRQNLEFQPKAAFLAGFAFLSKTRGTHGG